MLSLENADFIKTVLTFWDYLTPEEKALILENTHTITYKKDENIYGGAYECIGVVIVKSGELRTYIVSEDGREITLYRLNTGDVCILSASCVLKSITFDVNIDSQVESEVLLIDSAIFSEILNQNIYVENFSLKLAVERFSDVMWAMEQILFMSFDRRLAIFLADEISKSQSDTVNLTHEQIAKYIGSAREVVSRCLKYFAKEGILETQRGGVKIIDKAKLKKLI